MTEKTLYPTNNQRHGHLEPLKHMIRTRIAPQVAQRLGTWHTILYDQPDGLPRVQLFVQPDRIPHATIQRHQDDTITYQTPDGETFDNLLTDHQQILPALNRTVLRFLIETICTDPRTAPLYHLAAQDVSGNQTVHTFLDQLAQTLIDSACSRAITPGGPRQASPAGLHETLRRLIRERFINRATKPIIETIWPRHPHSVWHHNMAVLNINTFRQMLADAADRNLLLLARPLLEAETTPHHTPQTIRQKLAQILDLYPGPLRYLPQLAPHEHGDINDESTRERLNQVCNTLHNIGAPVESPPSADTNISAVNQTHLYAHRHGERTWQQWTQEYRNFLNTAQSQQDMTRIVNTARRHRRF